MVRTFILVLVESVSLSVYAQTKITVIDSESDKAVEGVAIRYGNEGIIVTDDQGNVILNIANGQQLYLSHIGYYPKWVAIQASGPDTISLTPRSVTLAEVVVEGFENKRPIIEQSASIANISPEEINRFDQTSIVDVFNTKAGVRVEERAPNSYRISIRGSSLRSPYGVRNVKVYWNDIPYTAPDGTTPLNLLDLSNIGTAEIIKGPAGSIYGAGTGGVIKFYDKTARELENSNVQSEILTGDYGLRKYRLALNQKVKAGALSVAFVRQKADGFREQTASDRKVLQVINHWGLAGNNSLSLDLLYSDLYYELPGALTAGQLAEDRTQARPGSSEKNASIRQKSLLTGASYTYQLNEKWNTKTSFYVNTSDFDHPFNTDYKKETQFGYGGRGRVNLDTKLGNLPFTWVNGLEYQFSKTSADNFGNVNGRADTLRFADDLTTQSFFVFSQADLELPADFILTLGLSLNYLNYDINRKVDMATGDAYETDRQFDPVLIPRIALLKKLNDQQALRASVSYGFSSPTIDEVRTNEGSINLGLEAEKGTNWEVGYRGVWWAGRLNVDMVLFYMKLSETITTYTSPGGVVLFRNAGTTNQRGMEAQVKYDLIRSSLGFVQQLRFGHSYTGHFFEFKDYQQEGEVYDGNDLTGVAPHTLVNTLDVNTRPGVYFNATHQFVDDIPLNDANTVYQDTYQLVSTRIGWKFIFGTRWQGEMYAGLQNLLDQEYSRGNDLNPYGGRYFQPAPGRNGFFGIKVGFFY